MFIMHASYCCNVAALIISESTERERERIETLGNTDEYTQQETFKLCTARAVQQLQFIYIRVYIAYNYL